MRRRRMTFRGRRWLWLVQGARSVADTLRGLPRVLLHLISLLLSRRICLHIRLR